jgi:hypothetical protein
MKYEIEIPDDAVQSLERRAAADGCDVPRWIEMVVISIASDRSGRLPDRPLLDMGIVAPCDLPRNTPRILEIQCQSKRELDPLVLE